MPCYGFFYLSVKINLVRIRLFNNKDISEFELYNEYVSKAEKKMC